jgi:DNA-binding NtrC family response regulator
MDDIPELCEYFIQLFSIQMNKSVRGLTSAAYKKLYAYGWPGNVRELRNVLNKAFIFCEGQEIDEDLIELPRAGQAPLPGPEAAPPAAPQPRQGRKRDLDIGREKMEALLRQNRGNIYQTAADLGITRQAVYYYLRKFGLNAETFRNQ